MSDLISVIVPIYKAEKYLPQCIESILGQTYENLEILLVDDGSPDRCGEICDEYAKRDARIRVIHQQNKGVSAARNAALDQATGAFIGFVDADDWIEPNMYERMYEWIRREQTRIVACGWFIYLEDRGREYVDRHHPPAIFSGEEALYRLLNIAYFHGYLCNKLLDAKLFQENGATLRLDERIAIGEDVLLMYQAIEASNSIYYCAVPLYHYRYHAKGTLNCFNESILSAVLARNEIMQLSRKQGGRILELAQGMYSEAAASARSKAAAAGEKGIARSLLPEAKKYARALLKTSGISKMKKAVFLIRIAFPALSHNLIKKYKKRYRSI